MNHGRTGLVALALCGMLGAARAETDEEILQELRDLRARVKQLEGRQAVPAAHDSVATAVEEYLATREIDGPAGGLVTAPHSRRIELGGMVRVRGEMQHDTPTPSDVNGERTNDFVLGRVRLHARAQIADRLGAYVELQDARIWGSEPGTAADTAGVDLSQGYVDFKDIAGTDTDLRLGRQATSFSDQRMIGALEWSNAGRRFDGLTLTHRRGEATYTGFGYRLADGFAAADPGDNDTDLAGGWAVWDGVDTVGTVEAFAILVNKGVQTPSEVRPGRFPANGATRFWTLGSRVHGKDADRGLDWDVQGAWQTGDLAGDDLGAWAARAELGIAFGKGRLGVEYDFATGERRTDDGDRDQFQVLFPTNHGWYGIHDLAAWSNLNAWSVNYGMPLGGDGLSLKAAYWHVRMDEAAGGWVSASGAPIRAGVAGADEDLGDEVDLVLTWKQSESVTWQLGWAHFWDGRFARDTEPDGRSHGSDFAYLQTVVTF